MPFDPSIYPDDWKKIIASIRKRSGGQCECEGECGIHRDHPGPRRCTERNGEYAKWAKGKIVLTVAHLCQDSMCRNDLHLKAMCQRCHLRYDSKMHQRHARQTRRSRKAIADLFYEAVT